MDWGKEAEESKEVIHKITITKNSNIKIVPQKHNLNGKITKDGMFSIERNPFEFKKMKCPFAQSYTFCGDWCALFGEPTLSQDKITLQLCKRTIYLDSFEDERIKKWVEQG